MNWYYALNGQQLGPVSEQEILQLASQGTLSAGSLIWRDGMGDWQPLSTALPAALATASPAAPQIGGFAVPEAQKDLVVQQMREGVSPALPGALNYAGFWIRFVAKFIDNLVLIFFVLILMGLLGVGLYAAGVPIEPSQDPNTPPPTGFVILMIAYYLFAFGFQIAYPAIMVAKYGATWGKMALGLKVVNDDGSKLSTGKSWGRGFAELVNQFTCAIGYIIAGFDSEKRALHDHICSTRVITTR